MHFHAVGLIFPIPLRGKRLVKFAYLFLDVSEIFDERRQRFSVVRAVRGDEPRAEIVLYRDRVQKGVRRVEEIGVFSRPRARRRNFFQVRAEHALIFGLCRAVEYPQKQVVV